MKPAIKTGAVLGTGGAINVELGWIPTFVQLYTGAGTLVTSAFLSWAVPFTSGGTVQIVAGHAIRGSTSRAVANVKEVMLTSGTWAGGTAVGFLILEEGSLVGTFGAEDIVVTNLASGGVTTAAGGDATVTANALLNVANNSAAVGLAAGVDTSLTRYEGTTAQYSKGFTIGLTLSTAGVLLRFVALRENT